MAENERSAIAQLRWMMDAFTIIPYSTTQKDVIEHLLDVTRVMADVIKGQDARIKALEGQAINMGTPIIQGEQRIEKRKVVTRVVDQQGVAHNVESEVDALVIPITGDLKSGETFSMTYTLTENDGGDQQAAKP